MSGYYDVEVILESNTYFGIWADDEDQAAQIARDQEYYESGRNTVSTRVIEMQAPYQPQFGEENDCSCFAEGHPECLYPEVEEHRS